MTMPFYSSVDQLLRDRSELARKGIARGRSVVVLTFTDGVLFVAENRSTALHKVSEIYDRIGFAAVVSGCAKRKICVAIVVEIRQCGETGPCAVQSDSPWKLVVAVVAIWDRPPSKRAFTMR